MNDTKVIKLQYHGLPVEELTPPDSFDERKPWHYALTRPEGEEPGIAAIYADGDGMFTMVTHTNGRTRQYRVNLREVLFDLLALHDLKRTISKCDDCGSTDVESDFNVDVNTQEITNWAGGGMYDNYCNTCKSTCSITEYEVADDGTVATGEETQCGNT